MEPNTILLLVGLLLLGIGIIGGGFEIKEIKVPKVNTISRILGFLVGIALVLYSTGVLNQFLPGQDVSEESTIVEANPVDSGQNTPNSKPPAQSTETPSDTSPKAPDTAKPEEVDALNAFIEINSMYRDPNISNEDLLEKYRELKEKYPDSNVSAKIEEKVNILKNSIAAYKTVRVHDESDTLTITQKLNLWKNYRADRSVRHVQKEIDYAERRVKKLEIMIRDYASVKTADKFVTCSNVSNRQPVGISSSFAPGKVYAWLRVNAPKNETLQLKWYQADGELFKAQPFKVEQNEGAGYRSYYAVTLGSDKKGDYEVRLYNSKDELIGRRTFSVGR